MIGVAVIAARVLHDEIAAREGARQANRAHHRFRAGRYETHLFETGIRRGHALGQFDFRRARRTVRAAELGRLGDGLHHIGMGVSQNQRAPGIHEVEITTPVSVVQVRAGAARDEARRAADSVERAHRRIHAAGNDFAGAIEQRDGLGRRLGRYGISPGCEHLRTLFGLNGWVRSGRCRL